MSCVYIVCMCVLTCIVCVYLHVLYVCTLVFVCVYIHVLYVCVYLVFICVYLVFVCVYIHVLYVCVYIVFVCVYFSVCMCVL